MEKDGIRKVIILGSGPAGYTAAIYTARALLNPLIIAGIQPGGQLMLTTEVENFPGFPEGIMGPDLMENMRKQAERFGAEFIYENVVDVELGNPAEKVPFRVKTDGGKTFATWSIIVATGASAKTLGLESEKKLMGRGVSTCATCLPTGSKLFFNSSLQEIDKALLNSRVLTHKGRFMRVKDRFSRFYDGELIRIKPRYFLDFETWLTPEHPVLVCEVVRDWYRGKVEISEPIWLPAEQVARIFEENKSYKRRLAVLFPIISETRDVEMIRISSYLTDGYVTENGKIVPEYRTHSSHALNDIIKLNGDFMRLCGYYLSDGTAHSRGVSFYFSEGEEEYAEDVKNIVKNVFGLDATEKKSGKIIRVDIWSKTVSEFFAELLGKGAAKKRMPHFFLFLPTEKQAEIIKGIWREDGSMRKDDFNIVTGSELLAFQIKIILLRLGIIPSVIRYNVEKLRRREGQINGRKIFRNDKFEIRVSSIWIEKMAKILGVEHTHTKRKRKNVLAFIAEFGGSRYAVLPISKIEKKKYRGFVWNIEVEGDNTYCSPSFAVHNCDGAFFKDKKVVVVGGGDSAMEEAIFLTRFATEVRVIHRRDKLRASRIMQERAFQNPKISFIWNSVVEEILDPEKGKVEAVVIKNVKTGEKSRVETDGVFIAIGHKPNTEFLKGKVEMDERGYIITRDKTTETSVPGIFAAGDVQDPWYRQAITAAGSGCMAALDAQRYLENLGLAE